MLNKCIVATLITSTLFKVISAFTSLNVSFTRKISSFQFTTGEDIFIQLYGISIDANVRLDKNSMRIENTYLSMANQRTVTITNRSDVIAHFRWTQYATQEEEDQQKLLLASLWLVMTFATFIFTQIKPERSLKLCKKVSCYGRCVRYFPGIVNFQWVILGVVFHVTNLCILEPPNHCGRMSGQKPTVSWRSAFKIPHSATKCPFLAEPSRINERSDLLLWSSLYTVMPAQQKAACKTAGTFSISSCAICL